MYKDSLATELASNGHDTYVWLDSRQPMGPLINRFGAMMQWVLLMLECAIIPMRGICPFLGQYPAYSEQFA